MTNRICVVARVTEFFEISYLICILLIYNITLRSTFLSALSAKASTFVNVHGGARVKIAGFSIY